MSGHLPTICPLQAVPERPIRDPNPLIEVRASQDENAAVQGQKSALSKLWSYHINARFAPTRSRQSMTGSVMRSRCT